MKQYRDDFLPLGWLAGYCSLTVLLWILNYFFWVNFASKDNFDVFWLAKWGRWHKWELLSANEIALFLDRLYLQVHSFSGRAESDAEQYKKATETEKINLIKKYIHPNFHHHIQENQRVFSDGKTMDLIDPLLESRLLSSGVNFSYGDTSEKLIAIIKSNQSHEAGGTLFLLGLSRDILYWYKEVSDGGDGHHVLSTGINDKWEFILYEPIYPRPNPRLIAADKVIQAMFALWSYEMLMIKDNPSHF